MEDQRDDLLAVVVMDDFDEDDELDSIDGDLIDGDLIEVDLVDVDDGEIDDVDDFPEDADDEDIDLVVAMYREDGQPVAMPMARDLANDFDELAKQLRRLPGDAGACALVSIAGEFFVVVRVRGRHIQTVLSDDLAAYDWPIARDVADFLGIEPGDPDEDDSEPIGDLDVFTDLGLSEFELEQICSDYDTESDQLALLIARKIGFGKQFANAALRA